MEKGKAENSYAALRKLGGGIVLCSVAGERALGAQRVTLSL